MLKRTDQIYRVEDISFDEQSKFIGKKLKDTELFNKKGITVVALKRANQYIFNPARDEIINAGDSVVIIGEAKEIREMKNFFK
jgi:K+/H+ antiporter YhaU regulatory subunit KhtT